MNDERTYAAVGGIVIYPPETREINGTPVKKFKIRTVTLQTVIDVTLWREQSELNVGKGDFVAVEGRVRQRSVTSGEGGPRTYVDIDASTVAHVPCYLGQPDSGSQPGVPTAELTPREQEWMKTLPPEAEELPLRPAGQMQARADLPWEF